MFRQLVLIGLGGAAGSVARYLTALYFKSGAGFPLGTFVANVLGCFLIGALCGLAARYGWLTPELRLLLVTGFCGGYTTFSTFTFENLTFLQTNQFGLFLSYTFGSFLAGLLATWLGLFLTKL
jgi:fluoride exporter